MKKYLSYLGASLVAIAAFYSCNKELTDPNEGIKGGIPFEITAASVDTKTAIDGFATSWVANDAINLFHAVAKSTIYTSDGEFTIANEDLEAKKFKGTLPAALEAGNYDWYAFYPYSKYNTTPAGSSQSDFGYTTIGGTSQTQTGNSSTAHLCGKPCPLYGVATAVASDVAPSIVMNHLTSIVEVNVTNNSGNELTVSSVSFTGTEDIVGTYYINFTQTPVVYTSRGESYVSKTASLNVADGEAIAADSSAKFYIAIKPFTVSNGVLKVAVNGYEKEIPISKKTVFAAGKIKKINFKYDYVPTLDTFTAINDISKLSDGASLLIVGKSDKKYYQLPVNPTVSDGKVTGVEVTVTDNTIQADATSAWKATKSGNYWQLSSGGKNIYHSNGGNKGTDLAYGRSTSYPWSITNYSTTDCTFKLAGVLYSNGTPTVKTRGMLMSGTTFGGYALSNIDATGYSAIMLFVKEEAPSTDPAIIANDITEVSARGGSAIESSYTIENPVDGTTISATCDGTVVTAVKADAGTILYTVSANITKSVREGSITLTYGDLTKVIKVSQLAPVFKVSRTEVELEAAASSSSTITVTSDFDWYSDTSAGAGFTSTPTTCEWNDEHPYTDGKTTVTIKASAENASEEGAKTLGTLTFTNSETEQVLEVTVTQKSSYVAPSTGTDVTFTLNYSSTETKTSTWSIENENVTLTWKTGTNTNNLVPSPNKEGSVRMYPGTILTITVPEGKQITKVVFTATSTSYNATKLSYNNVALTSDTWVLATPANSVDLTATANARFKSIVVTYE